MFAKSSRVVSSWFALIAVLALLVVPVSAMASPAAQVEVDASVEVSADLDPQNFVRTHHRAQIDIGG